ncbi:MAG: hypothetical protein CMJ72_06890 [Planctomycetaceae bacterium]|nr:hypothetical protein [Planctomycetaceae bacterium]
MARMYPRLGPKPTDSLYEGVIYHALKQQLPSNDYQVFHSVSWNASIDDQGEADFVITHPDHGYLVLEVKGGQRIYKEPGGNWISEDKNGYPHDLEEDPYDQSNRNSWAIQDHFRDYLLTIRGETDLPKVVIRHDYALVLEPDIDPTSVLREEDIKRTITGSSIENIGSFVEARMAGMQWTDREFIREDRELLLQWLGDFLDRRVKAETNFKTKASEVGIFFTDQENELLNQELEFLIENTRINVTGGAGTGKTVLAIRAAQEFAKQGKRVLWVCFNELLAESVAETLKDTGVRVHYYESLRKEAVGRVFPDQVKPLFTYRKNDDQETEAHRQDVFEDAVTTLFDDYATDCLIIDEGQDFRRRWFDFLRELVTPDESERHIIVFQDNNQAIYRYELGDLGELGFASKKLSKNNRNTTQIHTLASKLYKGCRYKGSGIAGSEPQFRYLDNWEQRDGAVTDIIHDLLGQGFTKDQIVVLTGAKAWVRDKIKENSNGLLERFTERGEGQVGIETARRFKGLESDVVILTDANNLMWSPDTENDDGAEKTVYSTVTRAKKLLFVVDQEKYILRLRTMLKT